MILHGCLNVAGSVEHGEDEWRDEKEDAPGDEQEDGGAGEAELRGRTGGWHLESRKHRNTDAAW
jgi:hypothetical protein